MGTHYSQSDVEIFQDVKDVTGDLVVINDIGNCSIWAYALRGVNVTEKCNVANNLGATDADLVEICENLSHLGDSSLHSNAIKQKCAELNVGYVLQLDNTQKSVVDFNESGNWEIRMLSESSVISESTDGFTLLKSWESSSEILKLYSIDF